MDPIPNSGDKPAETPRSDGPTHRVLRAVAVVLAAALTLILPGAWSDPSTGTVFTAEAGPSARSAPAPVDKRQSRSSDHGHGSRFFGFLEFDWDPDAPGGVPGFDPWPRP